MINSKRAITSVFFLFVLLSCLYIRTGCAAGQNELIPIPALIDIRTDFSDGNHSIEEIVLSARSRGFRVIFLNDHDRLRVAYGLPPFRNIVRKRVEFPALMSHGPAKFLAEVERISRKYTDMMIIPGCETSPFYYWTGSPFKKNLTLNDYDRKLLILNFNRPEDFTGIPDQNDQLTLRYTKRFLPRVTIFLIPFFFGAIFLKWKGKWRIFGIVLICLSVLSLIDLNPFRSSPFSHYSGDQGVEPYQEVIDYVKERNGLCFWNYPEHRSGIRDLGSVRLHTRPYPDILYRTKDYTGFAAIYGDRITATEPGREWDRCLREYCRGSRDTPPWAISTSDFHQEGRLGLKLGAFPTILLVRKLTKASVLEAIRKGRMYCSRGDGLNWPRLREFRLSGDSNQDALMGETLKTVSPPRIRIKVDYKTGESRQMSLLLIRGGVLIETFEGQPPLDLEYIDHEAPAGVKTYYRVMDKKKTLTSNPIFFIYDPPKD